MEEGDRRERALEAGEGGGRKSKTYTQFMPLSKQAVQEALSPSMDRLSLRSHLTLWGMIA